MKKENQISSKKIRIFAVMILSMLGIFVCYLIRTSQTPAPAEKVVDDVEKSNTITDVEKEKYPYMGDVYNPRENDMPLICCAFDFKRTSNYVPNKQYIKEIDPETSRQIQDSAIRFLTYITSGNARNITANTDDFMGELDKMLDNPCIDVPYDFDYAEAGLFPEMIAQWYADTETSLSGTAITSNSMVFGDVYDWCRCYVSVTVNDSSDMEAVSKAVGCEAKKGDTYNFIYDVAFNVWDHEKVVTYSYRLITPEEE